MIRVERVTAPNVLLQEWARERKTADRFFALAPPKRRQESFAFRAHTHPEVRKALEDLFHGKCAYCETFISTAGFGDVEQHRPKQRALGLDGEVAPDHYWWLAGEWSNLLLVCRNCSRNKGSRFPIRGKRAKPGARGAALQREEPLILDPCLDSPEQHLVFSDDGYVRSSTPEGQATIELLGLNRGDLVATRAKLCKQLRSQLETGAKLLARSAAKPSDTKVAADAQDWLETVRRLLEPKQEYGALYRQFVHRWASELGLDIARPIEAAAAETTVLVTEEHEQQAVEDFSKHTARQQTYSVEQQASDDKEAFYSGAKRIEWIDISNFKAIERLQVTFPTAQTAREPWLMLVGENAMGKSSVLQALALALMGEAHAETLALDASAFVRQDATRGGGRVSVKLTNVPEPITLRFRRSSKRFTWNTPDPKTLLLGYGATRLLRPRRTADADSGYVRVKNLFDPTAPLDDVEQWLLDPDAVDDVRFAAVAYALKDLLLLDEADRIAREDGRVLVFIGERKPVTLRQLSDGFQSVVALATDIMKILLERWPSMQDAEGIVLLDELEAHLHPSWKIEIVERLRRTFPRVAFVVSTHDPLCLKGLYEGEIGVLAREEDTRIAINTDLPPVADLRADQLLTSPLFGLYSTRGDDTVAATDRYTELLGKRRLTDAEELELEELEDRLARAMSPAESPRGRQLDQALWRAVVEGAPAVVEGDAPDAALASAARPRRRRKTSDEELQLQRELADLLGPVGRP